MIQQAQLLDIKELFGKDEYLIPIYQRNYAWAEKEITQLIRDVADYSKQHPDSDYYLGTLVVYARKTDNTTVFETIDGQQRLTTLLILLSVIKNEYETQTTISNWYQFNLSFESRAKSTHTLQAQFDNEEDPNADYNIAIQHAYKLLHKGLPKIVNEVKLTIPDFIQYLIHKVKILRVLVPKDTDLNHYFEIMNTRGEQLEKHEVLKSQMLEKLSTDPKLSDAFNKVWTACSDMERYVQYGFDTTLRKKLFGKSWNEFTADTLDDLTEDSDSKASERYEKSLGHIIGTRTASIQVDEKDDEEDRSERFTSVINFPNFLLHVLRIQTGENISLDDKQLLKQFDDRLKEPTARDFVLNFGYNLLKCRFLFDHYIIKRDFRLKKEGEWSLKKIKTRTQGNSLAGYYVNSFGAEEVNHEDQTEINRQILMLLSMFHVSLPAINYKHWFSAALNYLFNNDTITSDGYRDYLFMIAQSYFFDRILCPSDREPLDYYKMIFKDEYNVSQIEQEDLAWEQLDRGTDTENFAFNFLDYLLWKRDRKSFDFSFKSSVEHYYPQNPINGIQMTNPAALHSFGNLCLIKNSTNSRLSHYMPMAKKDQINQVAEESLKLKSMMKLTTSETAWNEDAIREHRLKMIKIFKENYN